MSKQLSVKELLSGRTYKDTIVEVTIYGQPLGDRTEPKDIADLYREDVYKAVINHVNKSWNGAFGVVIKDGNFIMAFTDPHGIDQLYYCIEPQVMVSPFINGLPQTNAFLDGVYLSEVSKWGYNTDDRTPWTTIKRVMPNELVIIDTVSKDICRMPIFQDYFNNDGYTGTETNMASLLKERVHEAVLKRVQMIPEDEKTIAMLLSGGLDSSCIACELIHMQKEGLLGDREIKFYTINNADDAPFVKTFVDMFDIEVTALSYDMKDIDLCKALKINEMPIDLGSMVPNQKMFEAIPETVIFTGDGPDEMLGGYNRIDQYDSQLSDTFEELPFYHYPRLNKAASYFGKLLVCPYTDRHIVELALNTPLPERTHKKILKDAYKGLIPDAIINRAKLPLKNDELRRDPMAYRFKVIDEFVKMSRDE